MSGSFISLCQDLPHARIIHFPLVGSSPCQYYSFPLTRIFPMSVSFPHARIIHFPMPGSFISPCQDLPHARIFPMPGSFISPYKDLPHASIIHFPLQGYSPCQYHFPMPGSSPCQDHSFPHNRIFCMPVLFISPYKDLPHARIIHFPL